MSNIEPVQIKHPRLSTYVVPLYLYEAVMRANLGIDALTDYDKVRKVASLEDMAAYANTHNNAKVFSIGSLRPTKITRLDLYYLLSRSAKSEDELAMTTIKMSKSDEIRKVAESYLSAPTAERAALYDMPSLKGVGRVVPNASPINRLGTPDNPSESLPYQLKTSGSNVFIIVGPGFSTYVETLGRSGQATSFVRHFVKHCNDLFSPAEVAKHPLFANFVSSLAA